MKVIHVTGTKGKVNHEITCNNSLQLQYQMLCSTILFVSNGAF
jgi:hypothetical protein